MPNDKAHSEEGPFLQRKLISATHRQSAAVIAGAFIGVVGTIVAQLINPRWSVEESLLRKEITSQQTKLDEMAAREKTEMEQRSAEEEKFKETQRQLESQLQELRTQLANSQSKLTEAQSNLDEKEKQLDDEKKLRQPGTANMLGNVKDDRPPKNSSLPAKRPVDVGVLRFESQDCVRTGTRVLCSGSVTNLGSEPEYLYLRWNECYIVDNFHNQLPLSNQILKVGDGMGKPLQPHLPIAFTISLDDPGENSTHATLILSVAGNQFPLPMERNVPVRLEFYVVSR
jgi:gas vesicle protein